MDIIREHLRRQCAYARRKFEEFTCEIVVTADKDMQYT